MQPSSPDKDRLQLRKLARKEANKAYLNELSACLDDTAQRMALDVRISFAEARAQLLAGLYAENPLRPKRPVSAWNHFVSKASKTALPSQAALEDAGEASDSETELAPRPKKRSLPEVSQAASKDYAQMTKDQREELRKEADQTVNAAAGEAIVKRKHAKRIPEMKTIGRRLNQLSKLHGVEFILVYASYDWGEKALPRNSGLYSSGTANQYCRMAALELQSLCMGLEGFISLHAAPPIYVPFQWQTGLGGNNRDRARVWLGDYLDASLRHASAGRVASMAAVNAWTTSGVEALEEQQQVQLLGWPVTVAHSAPRYWTKGDCELLTEAANARILRWVRLDVERRF